MKRKIALACVIALLGLTACATLFKGSTENVKMQASPVQADVFVNGEYRGKTPLEIKLPTKREYAVEFRAEGYQPRVYNISNRVGAGWVILDVVAGLVPVIIDAATGSWYTLDQKNIDAVLIKQQP